MKTNYHTHTTFCDGLQSPEEMVLEAIRRKFDILGFSGHSLYPFASSWHIAPRAHKAYCAEILRLSQKYKDSLQIYLGFEADFVKGLVCAKKERFIEFNPDFFLGAVHYVPSENGALEGFFEADGAFDEVQKTIQTYWGGNAKKAVQTYFATQREMLLHTDCTFLAHADLIRKQNSPLAPKPLFCEDDEWYKKELKATAESIQRAGVCVEVNTGGMSRGYLSTPYPSKYFLELLHERGVPVTINSDAHRASHLDYGFLEALALLKDVGYKETLYFSEGKLCATPL